MKINKTLIATLSLTAIALSSTVAQASDKIRIATEGAWAPFNFIDASGQPQGFDVDIANALCEKMKVECEIVTQDWDGLIPALKVKKFDAIVASMSITKERMKQVDFSDPYYSGGLRYLAAKGKPFDTSKAGLKGKVIGAQRATVAGLYLEDNLADVVEIKLYDNNDAVYLDLQAGRLDGALSDELPTFNWLKSDAGKGFEFKGQAFAKDDKIGIAVRKGDKLRAKLNKALNKILNDGTYEKINAKYFPFSIY
ncbi:transporter substrate-binding domain-containing protein [Motiliproteus sp. MSK22-1]|uniref:transporter substrate-binding domain-containing protein n=1 Tax=Motiliproteus sp. MSK22-1 TaxID=1897630 RepID=UPI0009761F70|nr:transporter substrate-binding domain-containing protein [Motiliproteus sp. MSK22-1]OMH30420.1 amino acid ABC transporter [Motiliproteus sp. MSK22-1]